MHRIILAIVLTATVGMAAINYYDDVTLIGTEGGVSYYDLSGGGASGWVDTNVYLIYHNMNTNAAGGLDDISGNTRDMVPSPSVAAGASQFVVTNDPEKVAFTFDGVDDVFDLTTLTGLTNATAGTIHAWVNRQDAILDSAQDGEYLVNYCVKASGIQRQLSLFEDPTPPSSLATNTFAGALHAGNSIKWQFNTVASDTVKTNDTWQLVTIVQNGTIPVMYLDGVLEPIEFSQFADITAWTDQISPDILTLGGWWYANTLYAKYDGDMAVFAQLDYAQSSNSVYEFWQNTNPTNNVRIR